MNKIFSHWTIQNNHNLPLLFIAFLPNDLVYVVIQFHQSYNQGVGRTAAIPLR